MGRVKKVKGYVFKSTYERCFFTTRRPIERYEIMWTNPKAKTIEIGNLDSLRDVKFNTFKKATLTLEIE